MGHYWRGMCPREAEEHDDRIATFLKTRELQKKLRNLPAEHLTVGDILDIGYEIDIRENFDHRELLARLRAIEERHSGGRVK